MKKLINQPEDFVSESLAGMAVAHPDLLKVNMKAQKGNTSPNHKVSHMLCSPG